MIASSPRRASAVDAASSKTFHQRALSSRWWRSGSLAVTLRSACTVQRCSSAAGHSSLTAFHRPGAPSATTMGRRAQAAIDEVAPERQPGVEAPPAGAEPQSEQDLSALQRDAPRDEHALGGLVVGVQLQVDRVQEAVDDVVLLEPALAPAPVALPGVLQDPRDGRARRDRLVEGLLKHGLDVARRQPAQERADHQRLQRVGTRHVLAQQPRLEAQLRRVANPRALELDRARRGRTLRGS